MNALIRWVNRVQIIAFLAAMAMAGPVRAAAIYDAIISSTLTIESILNLTSPGTTGGLQIEGEAVVFDSDMLTFGDATADADGSATPGVSTPLGVDEGIDLLALASGSAGAGGGAGAATSYFFTEGLIALANTSDSDIYQVAFSLDYAVAASAIVSDPANELALALAELSLFSGTETDPLLEIFIEADTDFGLPGDLVSDNFQFTLSLLPGDSEELFMIADVEGLAVRLVEVGLPTSLWLLGPGLLALGARRRSR